jgi:hypothetical protein
MRFRRPVLFLVLVGLAALWACATESPTPASGKGTIEGRLRLVPREGVTPGHADNGPYASIRYRDVTFVDYDHPGFAVVYLKGRPAPGGTARFAIRSSTLGPRFDPPRASVGASGTFVLSNESDQAHAISCPSMNLLHRLDPGATEEIATPPAGAHSCYLLDAPETTSILFVSPGPFAVVSDGGRWALRDVEPGPATVVAWHPRFPSASRAIEVKPGQLMRLDFDLRVDAPDRAAGGASDEAP